MKNILIEKKIYIYIAISVLMLGIGALVCFNSDTYSISYGDAICNSYGASCIRVHNTQELLNSFEGILKNYRSGAFHFISDPYTETINSSYFVNWFNNSKYVLDDYNRNIYSYDEKGEYEPFRFKLENDLDVMTDYGFLFSFIRTTGERKTKSEYFANILKDKLPGSSNFEKIYSAYRYIHDTYIYNYDPAKSLEQSGTDLYAGLIERRTDCIGVSIAFSYLMKLYGIESYIVDNITIHDVKKQQVSSYHTWNVVKLGEKFYKVDITGNVVLGGLSSDNIQGKTLNLSSTSYTQSVEQQKFVRNYNFDPKTMNNDIDKAERISAPPKTTANVVNQTEVDTSNVDYGVEPGPNVNTTIKITERVKGIDKPKPVSGEKQEESTSKFVSFYEANKEAIDKMSKVSTTKGKIIEIFTSIASENGTTRVVNYKVDDNGDYKEISQAEAEKIEKDNKKFKLSISTKQKNIIITICIILVFILIVIQVIKRVKYKKGSGYTTFTFYVDK